MDREQILSRIRERLVRGWAYKVGHDVAEDIAQETLLVLHTKYSDVTAEVDLAKLGFTISTNFSRSIPRKMRREKELSQIDGWDPPDSRQDPDRIAFLVRVREEIPKLSGRCSKLLAALLDGYTPEEIKVMLDSISVNTVYVWTNRCIESLKRNLGLGV